MTLLTKWCRNPESRHYLQLALLFNILYWLLKARIYIGCWAWAALSADLPIIIWMYWVGKRVSLSNAFYFTLSLFTIYNLPHYIKENINSHQWLSVIYYGFGLAFCFYYVIFALLGRKIGPRSQTLKLSAEVTVPQFCLVIIGFFFLLAYLINKDDRSFQLSPPY